MAATEDRLSWFDTPTLAANTNEPKLPAATAHTADRRRPPDEMDRDQIKDMIEVSDARAETRLEKALGELRGDIRGLDAKVSALPGRWEILLFLVGTTIAIVGLIIAVLSFGGDRLSTGAELSTIAKAAAFEAVAESKRTAH